MDVHKRYNNYDAFAEVYNRHWGPKYGKKSIELLTPLLLKSIEPNSKILDLCCGTGHIFKQHRKRTDAVFMAALCTTIISYTICSTG